MLSRLLRLTKEAVFAAYFYKNPLAYYAERLRLSSRSVIRLFLRNGVSYALHSGTSDVNVLNEIWNRKIYDRLISRVNDGSNVIDIGAQVGVFTVKAATYAPRVKVWSYEPMPANFELLKENISANNLSGAVTALNCAVSGGNKPLTLYVHEGDSGGASMHPHGDAATMRTVVVPSVTLADVFSQNKIDKCDFLKMDCEGAELDILLNAPKDLLRRIASITLEWHDDHNQPIMPLPEFRKFLFSAGYENDFDEATGTLYAWRVQSQ